jgi:hypothetical protein
MGWIGVYNRSRIGSISDGWCYQLYEIAVSGRWVGTTTVRTRSAEYTRLRQGRWRKFFEITADSAPLVRTIRCSLNPSYFDCISYWKSSGYIWKESGWTTCSECSQTNNSSVERSRNPFWLRWFYNVTEIGCISTSIRYLFGVHRWTRTKDE